MSEQQSQTERLGYTIRIVEPSTVASTFETRVWGTLDETEQPIAQLVEKFLKNGIAEYLIHVVSQSTGNVERTLRRKLQATPMVEDVRVV